MKGYFLLVMAWGTIFSLKAQNAQKVEYGLNLNANLTSMDGNGLKASLTAGFSAGVFSRINLSRKWNLQPEVNFNYTNARKAENFLTYYVNSGSNNALEKIHLSYVSVPVLLGYKVNEFFTINAGPQYSFLIYENDNLVKENKAAFKRNDLGLAIGAQVKLENVGFYARYVHGFLNINDIDNRYKWYSRQIQIGMNVKLF